MLTLKDICDTIDNEVFSIENATNLLNKVSSNNHLLLLLNSIVDSDNALRLIAKDSYVHVNSFYKIILHTSSSSKLRLHVWTKNQRTGKNIENIHDHRWPFVSKIILGEYSCLDYEVSEDKKSKEYYCYHYYPRKGKSQYALKRIGKQNLILKQENVLEKGDFLISKPRDLHRVIQNTSKITASLMYQGNAELDYAMIYNENEISEFNNIKCPSADPEEIKNILLILIHELANEKDRK